ncbi:hypothetical protein ACQ86B_29090 (plasmid) [Mycolicibacterium aichiense]|uniref:hypothetical protein n=1 Tax=Mycolicibacterium aichiense TaxID=1799 RepID=UPI003D67AFE0
MQRRVSQSPVIAGVWLAMVAGAALALVSAGTARADAPAAAHPQLDWGSLRWPLVAIGIATVPVAGLLIAISATLRDRATLERVFGATPTGIDPIGASVRDIAPVVRRARRKALWRSVSILVTATLISVLVWYLRTLLKAGVIIDLLMFPLLFALLTVAYMWWERRRSDGLPFEKQPVLPAVIGTVGALVVVLMASYAINAAVAIAVLSTFFYVHAFSSPPVIPIIAMIFIAYVFVRWIPKILRFTSTPLDLSRRLAAPTVSETLAADHRREVLFLRSFADDDLAIRTHRSMRHSPVEFATTLPFERFEVVLTWTAWRIGPVCAIGKPKTGHALQPLGAAREFYADDTWQHAAHDRIASAALVIFVVGRTEGLQWEIRNARAQGALERCLFVVPPVALDESRERLTKLADMVGVESASLPPSSGTDAM